LCRSKTSLIEILFSGSEMTADDQLSDIPMFNHLGSAHGFACRQLGKPYVEQL